MTGRHLGDRAALKQTLRTPTGSLEIRGASTNNLQGVDVDVPLGVLCVVSGVAGSGKSSLIHGSLAGRDGVVSIDQDPIRGSRRSSPATYTGLLDPIRKAFAKANGVKPALFSANSDGACPACNGAGEARTPAAHEVLRRLLDVGLGYLTLGQPLPSLSGGERQRLKLATRMAEKGGVYLLDEPTAGLHLADVEQLLALLDGLVDGGTSVIVIEHHQAVMAHADWIVDVGPGAGHDGGRIVFEGAPTLAAAGAARDARRGLTLKPTRTPRLRA